VKLFAPWNLELAAPVGTEIDAVIEGEAAAGIRTRTGRGGFVLRIESLTQTTADLFESGVAHGAGCGGIGDLVVVRNCGLMAIDTSSREVLCVWTITRSSLIEAFEGYITDRTLVCRDVFV
jgi:hypothetical protein